MGGSATPAVEFVSSHPARRRRVLFLVGQLGYGGSEGQLRLLLENLDHDSWESCLLVFHPSPNADYAARLEDRGVRVIQRPSWGLGRFGKILATVTTARSFRPDVVHSWTVHDNPFARLAKIAGGASLCWGSLRGSTRSDGFRSLPRWYRELTLNSVQRLVVNCEALGEELTGLGVSPDRILVLPNCVEQKKKRQGPNSPPVFETLSLTPGDAVFACIGNLRAVKNQILFVRAMAELLRERTGVRGLVVGETIGGETHVREEIEQEILSRGLGNRVFTTGFCGDVPGLMSSLTAVCLTSTSEGMPNVLLEAMAAGVPVIATRVGGVPEVVDHGITGLLVDPGDVRALAGAMGYLLDHPCASRRMAAAGLERVRHQHDCTSMAASLSGAFRTALEGTPAEGE